MGFLKDNGPQRKRPADFEDALDMLRRLVQENAFNLTPRHPLRPPSRLVGPGCFVVPSGWFGLPPSGCLGLPLSLVTVELPPSLSPFGLSLPSVAGWGAGCPKAPDAPAEAPQPEAAAARGRRGLGSMGVSAAVARTRAGDARWLSYQAPRHAGHAAAGDGGGAHGSLSGKKQVASSK